MGRIWWGSRAKEEGRGSRKKARQRDLFPPSLFSLSSFSASEPRPASLRSPIRPRQEMGRARISVPRAVHWSELGRSGPCFGWSAKFAERPTTTNGGDDDGSHHHLHLHRRRARQALEKKKKNSQPSLSLSLLFFLHTNSGRPTTAATASAAPSPPSPVPGSNRSSSSSSSSSSPRGLRLGAL